MASTEKFFDSLIEFKFRQSRFPLELKIPFCNSVYHGKNSIRYFGPQIWKSVTFEIRNAATLEDFFSRFCESNRIICFCA